MEYTVESMPGHHLAGELSPGERLLWSGRPRQGIFLQSQDAMLIPFSVLWFGFACFWEMKALESGNTFMILWGVPFVVVGLYIAAGRFVWDEWDRGRTYYGLTDRRAIIVRKGWRGQVKSVDYRGMEEMHLDETSQGRGTITFGPEPPGMAFGHRSGMPASPQFVQIEGGREVYHRILRRKEEARQS